MGRSLHDRTNPYTTAVAGPREAAPRQETRESRLEEEAGVAGIEQLPPERVNALQGYYNMTLQSINQVRNPGSLPDLAALPKTGPAAGAQDPELARREQLAGHMVASDTPVKPSAEEAAALKKSLAAVPADVLSYADSRNTKVQVVHEGDDLNGLKVLRAQDPGKNQALAPDMAKFGTAWHKELNERFTVPTDQLQKEREKIEAELTAQGKPISNNPMAMAFGGGAQEKLDPRLTAIDDKLSELCMKEAEFKKEKLKESHLPVKEFSIPMPPSAGFLGAGVGAMMTNMPTNLEGMASIHGAKTDEEKQEFYKSVRTLNGGSLDTAMQKEIKQYEDLLPNIKDPDARRETEKLIREAKAHPEKMPFSAKQGNILVPDTFYYHAPGTPDNKPGTRYDEHDFGTLQGWHDTDTGKVNSGRDEEGRPEGIMGQYFFKDNVNRITVRDHRLSDSTPVHELGHAIDAQVERDDPAFHKNWSTRLHNASEDVDKGKSKSISDYSRTNDKEYLAEGFHMFYDDPKLLKSKDPALYGLVEELSAKAAELGKQPPR